MGLKALNRFLLSQDHIKLVNRVCWGDIAGERKFASWFLCTLLLGACSTGRISTSSIHTCSFPTAQLLQCGQVPQNPASVALAPLVSISCSALWATPLSYCIVAYLDFIGKTEVTVQGKIL